MFWVVVCTRMSLINLIFWLIYLPFINPVWSGLIGRFNTLSYQFGYYFRRDFVVQFARLGRFVASFGIRVIVPLRRDIDR